MTNIVVAFKNEALPIINELKLKPIHDYILYPVYFNEQDRLIISGLGQNNAYQAVQFLCSMFPDRRQAKWINFGIAGSAYLPMESFVLADVVVAIGINQVTKLWKLHPPNVQGARKAQIRTVINVEKYFKSPWVFEMEAGGFLQALEENQSLDNCIILKFISDGPKESNQIDLKKIKKLLNNSADHLIKLYKFLINS